MNGISFMAGEYQMCPAPVILVAMVPHVTPQIVQQIRLDRRQLSCLTRRPSTHPKLELGV